MRARPSCSRARSASRPRAGTRSRSSQALVARLDAGADAALGGARWRALVEIVRGKLAIAKPGHDAWDFRAELD